MHGSMQVASLDFNEVSMKTIFIKGFRRSSVDEATWRQKALCPPNSVFTG